VESTSSSPTPRPSSLWAVVLHAQQAILRAAIVDKVGQLP
jgi:hypothetical protein